MDVEVLRSHTTYHGYEKVCARTLRRVVVWCGVPRACTAQDSRACKWFFNALQSFTGEERSKFIRFAWGRSRLPKGASWDKPFKLTKKNGGDAQLPIAHTCFFQVCVGVRRHHAQRVADACIAARSLNCQTMEARKS